MLRDATSPITMPTYHGIAWSVILNVTDADLAHNRARQPQYCWLREMLRALNSLISVPDNHGNFWLRKMLRAPNSPVTVPTNLSIADYAKCYGPRPRP